MSKMNELNQVLEELHNVGEKLISISDTLRDCFSTHVEPEPATAEVVTVATKPEQPATPQLSFIDVRRILSAKSRAGYTDEVKALLQKYGADKLSELAPEHYAAIAAEAEVL